MVSIFSQIIAGREVGSFVYRDDLVVAFLDVEPITPGHTLVVPVEEVASFADLSEKTCGRMFRIAGAISRAIPKSGITCDGVNLLLSDGKVAGQEVPHAHLHVVPRYRGDGFSWSVPSHPTNVSRGELDSVAAGIAKQMV